MNFNSFNKLSEYIWINGEFIKWEESYIHVLTHSLHYAGAVFEGERAYNGNVFKLTQHTKRLLESARYMYMDVPYSVQEIDDATNELLKKNNLLNAYIRPLIWKGAGSLALCSHLNECNILIMAQESNPMYKNDLRLCVTPWRKISTDAMPAQCKGSAHYAMMAISEQMARNIGYDDALILDQYGYIAETSTANIFFAQDNMLITPIADRFLNGITRQTVIEIAQTIGMKVKEDRLTLEDIKNYESCFLTGTAAEIKAISSINYDDKCLEFSNIEIVKRFQKEYAKIVGKII